MPQQPEKIKDLDQAREYFRAKGLYAGNRNLFSDWDLYVGVLHEGEDFDRVEDAFYLYRENGKWVTRHTPPDGEPVISHYASFPEVLEARYPGNGGGSESAPPKEEQVTEAEPAAEPAQEPAPSVEDAEEGDVPEGFEPLFRTSPFLDLLGPFYNKLTGQDLVLGFFAGEKHCNSRGIVHGGVLSSLADVALGSNAVIALDQARPLVTVNLSVDYAGAAKLGDWIEIATDVQKVGGQLAFANCYIRVGTKRIARASAVFSVAKA
jgi:uncharacterized protein (TIGR00369 family)